MKMNRIVALLLLLVAFSCKDDDDAPAVEVKPPRLLSEVAVEDDAKIKEYLKTHFYNHEEFANPPADFDFKIKIDRIAGDNADKIPMFDQEELKSEVITVLSSAFGRTDGEEVSHTLYYLVAREGTGESPTIGDNVVLQYEGSLLDGVLFDGWSTPIKEYLSGNLTRGYGNGVKKFKSGTGPIENGDGTVSYEGYGVGLIFIPSGLGYFDKPREGSGIPKHEPLIFKIDVLAFEKDTDFDGDGIPSILEDLDGDGNLNNDNTDGDAGANHRDIDDDNDGKPTRDEIEIDDEGNITYPDTDGDGTPDYLDSDS